MAIVITPDGTRHSNEGRICGGVECTSKFSRILMSGDIPNSTFGSLGGSFWHEASDIDQQRTSTFTRKDCSTLPTYCFSPLPTSFFFSFIAIDCTTLVTYGASWPSPIDTILCHSSHLTMFIQSRLDEHRFRPISNKTIQDGAAQHFNAPSAPPQEYWLPPGGLEPPTSRLTVRNIF